MTQPNIFAGMKEAQLVQRGSYLEDGFDGNVTIKTCKMVNTQDKGPAFIADLILDDGSERNWFVKMMSKPSMGNIKAFVLANLGIDVRDPKQLAAADLEIIPRIEEIAHAAVTQGFLDGKRAHVRVTKVPTKAGGEFSRHDWTPATPITQVV
jgi:hypothetical protein